MCYEVWDELDSDLQTFDSITFILKLKCIDNEMSFLRTIQHVIHIFIYICITVEYPIRRTFHGNALRLHAIYRGFFSSRKPPCYYPERLLIIPPKYTLNLPFSRGMLG